MNRQRPAPHPHPWVPKTHAVHPGAAVNIILKADQPTGRTVSGTIQDVLTRGNHPRGIKVRLTDGRVGRVQSMLGASTASGASSGDPGGVVEGMRAVSLADARDGEGPAAAREGQGLPAQQIGLEAYIKEAKPKTKRKGKGKGNMGGVAAVEETEEPTSSLPLPALPAEDLASCPVCGEFEGDEAAVSHHVASHFDA